MTVTINPKEHVIYISMQTETDGIGVSEVVGHLATINDFPISIHTKSTLFGLEAIISDVKTGTKITSFYIYPEEMDHYETKEIALKSFYKKLMTLTGLFNNDLIQDINNQREDYPELKAPEPIEDYEKFVQDYIERKEQKGEE